MSKKMLIDASHPEETRVVIVNGTRVEELDFESRNKRQLRGNVYLARVTRVEPSLQAAFVEYGGNRHGFLAFSEIHPDYYQIPYEDRMALLEAEEADHEDDEEDETEAVSDDTEIESDDSDHDENLDPDDEDVSDEADGEVAAEQVKVASKRRKRMSRRRYKIQEVIKRGQILLIQAVKEERGNKGAAMTTYLSLAGRYCVLMPNTPRGGGISRKIANGADRKRLKSIMSDLEVPQGMGVIVRTAGGKRTKIEIKRDYDYLSRLWETIRETTLKSIAPALIHEEGNLVKRSIRDLYNKDIDEILVQGDDAYKTAKDFIKMLMPSHAKNVKSYKEQIPLFLRYQVERQIEASLDSVVQLKSGGYLVIHPTEALVSVDVNSGRSTRERNIERTALKTNLEAAEEVARQMRLRDLAGLVVIDFIDMDEHKNNRAVEKRMKECLSQDRARVQTDRISQFGLMEISRQRRRRSLLEGSTTSCEHCEGVGRKRTIESSALVAIRAVEEIGARRQMKRIRLKVSPDVAIYIFNEKRDLLQRVDDEFDMFTELVGDDTLIRPSFIVDSIENREAEADPLAAIEEEQKREAKTQQSRKSQENSRRRKKDDNDENEDEADSKAQSSSPTQSDSDTDENGEPRKRRRRRGRRGGRGKRTSEHQANTENTDEENTQSSEGSSADEAAQTSSENEDQPSSDTKPKAKRARGRRKAPSRKESKEAAVETIETSSEVSAVSDEKPQSKPETKPEAKDDKPRSTARRKAPSKKPAKPVESEADTPDAKKRRRSRSKKVPASEASASEVSVSETVVSTDDTNAAKSVSKTSTRRRKAPAKVKTDTTTKKAPARKAAPAKATSDDVETAKKPTKRAPARKKAPTKTVPAKTAATKAASKKKTASKLESTVPARRAAPARKKAEPKDTSVKSEAKPAKKAAPKKAAPKKAETKVDAPARARRKAPARKAEAIPSPKSEPEPVTPIVQKPVQTATSAPVKTVDKSVQSEAEKKPKKKRGWLSRLTKGD